MFQFKLLEPSQQLALHVDVERETLDPDFSLLEWK